MYSAEFADLARIHPEDLTRQFVTLLLNLRKGSIDNELDRYFEVLRDHPLADSVSPSAFCQAR